MTWSVSASGSKSDVKAAIIRQVGTCVNHESATAGLIALVDDQKGTHVSISGSGWDHNASLSIQSHTPVADPVIVADGAGAASGSGG
jgi:hypothetical protein